MPDPKILVAGMAHRTDYYAPYLDAIRGAGGDPELKLLDPAVSANGEAVGEFLRSYWGVLFPGGVDIDPRYYGEKPHAKLGAVDAPLDEGQLSLARAALAGEIPVLGICRGLQLLAVAVEAKLFQDLPSDFPSSKVPHDIKDPKDHLAHYVDIDKDTQLADVSRAARFEVNSRHHQAVKAVLNAKRIGPFRIVARAPDGVIEGLEDPERPFRIAVQWHPENLAASHAPSRNLFRHFVAACVLR